MPLAASPAHPAGWLLLIVPFVLPAWPPPQFSFTLHFGFSGIFAAESLRLCFEREEEAREWHGQLAELVARLERQGSGGAWRGGEQRAAAGSSWKLPPPSLSEGRTLLPSPCRVQRWRALAALPWMQRRAARTAPQPAPPAAPPRRAPPPRTRMRGSATCAPGSRCGT